VSERRVISNGKQVLLDDDHLADAVSEHAARVIADALQYFGGSLTPDSEQDMMDLFE